MDTKADFRGLCVVSPKVIWVSGTKGTYARTTDAGHNWSVGTVPGAEKLDFRAGPARIDGQVTRACAIVSTVVQPWAWVMRTG
jgi:hypothetical protein